MAITKEALNSWAAHPITQLYHEYVTEQATLYGDIKNISIESASLESIAIETAIRSSVANMLSSMIDFESVLSEEIIDE